MNVNTQAVYILAGLIAAFLIFVFGFFYGYTAGKNAEREFWTKRK